MIRTTTWDSLGTKTDTSSIMQALKDLDLDYTVGTMKCGGHHDDAGFIDFPNRMITYREDTLQPFGIVSDRYKVIQNQTAFEFIDEIDDIKIVRGGHTSWGSIWLIGELPEVKVLDDSIKPNLIFQTSHDGSVPMQSTICMLRIACQNQFTHSFAESPATVRIHHRGDVTSKLSEAATVLRSADEYIQSYQAQAEFLAAKKITPTIFNKVLEKFFNVPEEGSKRVIERAEDRRQLFIDAYNSDDNNNLRGTRWGVINAYTDYLTHREGKAQSLFLDSVSESNELSTLIEYMTPSR